MIRAAHRGDPDQSTELGRETFSQMFGALHTAEDLSSFLGASHSPDLYRDWLSDPAVDLWILEDEAATAVGYAMLRPCHLPVDPMPPGALELSRIYLLAHAQGGGRGSALLSTVLERVEERGRPVLFLSVFSGNAGAQRLYARHGFRQVGQYLFEVGQQLDREFIWRWE